MEVVDRELRQTFFGDLRDELALSRAQHERRPLSGLGVLRIAAAELECELDLALVDVLDRERAQPSLLDDVHACPVGDAWHGHLRQSCQRGAVVERAAQGRARIDEKPLRFLGALAVFDVRVRAEPLDDLTAAVPHRDRARQVPAVGLVRRASETELVFVRVPGVERLLPELHCACEILGMSDVGPTRRDELRERRIEVVERPLVDVVELTVRHRGPDLVGLSLRQEAVALLALAAELGELLLLQLFRLLPELLRLLVQLDEHGNLGAQHFGTERLEDVVDRARGVAAEDVLVVLGDRGDEDDRDVPRALALLDQHRRLETVEHGHLDVEEDDRDFVLQQPAERLLAGVGIEQVLPEGLEDRLQRE